MSSSWYPRGTGSCMGIWEPLRVCPTKRGRELGCYPPTSNCYWLRAAFRGQLPRPQAKSCSIHGNGPLMCSSDYYGSRVRPRHPLLYQVIELVVSMLPPWNPAIRCVRGQSCNVSLVQAEQWQMWTSPSCCGNSVSGLPQERSYMETGRDVTAPVLSVAPEVS